MCLFQDSHEVSNSWLLTHNEDTSGTEQWLQISPLCVLCSFPAMTTNMAHNREDNGNNNFKHYKVPCEIYSKTLTIAQYKNMLNDLKHIKWKG